MKKFFPGFLLAFALVWAGCAQPATPETPPSFTPSLTPYPTSTVEWFPATHTPTPPPSVVATPTVQLLEGVGSVAFREDFESLDEWMVPNTSRGEINLDRGQMNIIILEPQTYLTAIRESPEFDSFYAEVEVSTSLCQGKDEYGVIFRAAGPANYYRYALSCDGEVRLEKLVGGSAVALQPWTPSASVPPAAPSQTTLGILAEGDQLTLFIDQARQFSIADSELVRGTMGVYARSVSETAVTVSFSRFVVRELVSPE
jgi:hypothetical protein